MIYVGGTEAWSSQGWRFVAIDEDRAACVEGLNDGALFRLRVYNGPARRQEMVLMRDTAIGLLSALMHAVDDGSDPFVLIRPQHVDGYGNLFTEAAQTGERNDD